MIISSGGEHRWWLLRPDLTSSNHFTQPDNCNQPRKGAITIKWVINRNRQGHHIFRGSSNIWFFLSAHSLHLLHQNSFYTILKVPFFPSVNAEKQTYLKTKEWLVILGVVLCESPKWGWWFSPYRPSFWSPELVYCYYCRSVIGLCG